ncbi:hypothetical protein RBH29_08640 [Herbivorax sp. ANBcel31]|uniref:hypothetical protein n=1 Tax=Herbivorax sp. ANBcel31 TaxID=3069754 RepID=UPI0027B7F22D|nr:hypothetical protein [Herbivorax sp. ANBcel31]MDQ2086493.1 hypothetical protein [Herbivorax sp. ANBcel31]
MSIIIVNDPIFVSSYAEKYFTMLKIGDSVHYTGINLNNMSSPALNPIADYYSYDGKIFSNRHNFMTSLISIAYNFYKIDSNFGYSGASGVIYPENEKVLVKREAHYFTSLFRTQELIRYKTPNNEYAVDLLDRTDTAQVKENGVVTGTIEPFLRASDGTYTDSPERDENNQRTGNTLRRYNVYKYFDIKEVANALGFDVTFEKDDVKKIIFLKVSSI